MPMARRTIDRMKQAASSLGQGLTDALDAAIFAVAPGYGSQRRCARRLDEIAEQQKRAALSAASGGHWYAATKPDELRGARWLTSNLSADSYMDVGLKDLRDKCRSLVCDMPFIGGGVDCRVNNVVGTGLNPCAQIQAVEGLISQAEADRWNKELDDLWQHWAEFAGGRQRTFADVEDLAYRTMLVGGDSLTVHSVKPLSGKVLPLHCSVVDPVRIENPPDRLADPLCRQGVTIDEDGDATGFYVRHTHPGDTKEFSYEFDFYAQERACFLMRQKWADQWRGIPWMAPAAVPSADFKDWTETEVVKAQMAASIGVIVSVAGNPLTAAAARATGQSAGSIANGNGGRVEEWRPGQILYAGDGTKVDFLNPNHPSTTYGMFAEWQLLAIAAALDWPYEWLVKDRRRSSYSAGRLAELDGGIVIRTDQQLLSRRLGAPTWRAFVTQAFLTGKTSIRADLFLNYFELIARHIWIPQPRPLVDPETEVKAAVMAIDNNLDTLRDVLGSYGKQHQDILQQRVKERAAERDGKIDPPAYMLAQAQLDAANRDPSGAPNAGKKPIPEKTQEQLVAEAEAGWLAACAS